MLKINTIVGRPTAAGEMQDSRPPAAGLPIPSNSL